MYFEPSVAEDGVLAYVEVLAQPDIRDKRLEVTLENSLANEPAKFVRHAPSAGESRRIYPAKPVRNGPDLFRSFAKGFEVDVQPLAAIEISERVDPIAKGFDDAFPSAVSASTATSSQDARLRPSPKCESSLKVTMK